MPFRHLVVVDLATLGAAPQIAAFFGDFGARVIKVEHPRGDGLRQLVDEGGAALQWKIINRNKECVTLDVSKPAGRELLGRLLDRADLLVSNLNPERLARWDLTRESLARRYPRLVSLNLTAYGLTGPWAERPGSGTLAEAISGLAALTGAPGGPPTLSPVGLGDHLGVLQGIIAALIGLYGRDARSSAADDERTAGVHASADVDDGNADAGRVGDGPLYFDVSMYQPLLGLLSHRIATAVRAGAEPGRHGNRFPHVAPRNAYRAADGNWIALTAGTNELARRLFEVIGRPELAADPRFGENLARVAHVDELDDILGEWIGARGAAEVIDALTRAGVSAANCAGLLDVAANPHFRARGDLIELHEGGESWTLGAPLPPGQIRWLGRDRGADNDAVYRHWLGLAEEEIERLRLTGMV